ncbi:MAG: VF530 family protein [Gammaproteobacteria bacterium]|nr:VF530 family protein [Gammaproteobacteria bacterium]
MAIQAPNQPQQNNPLHGFTLQQILELLVEHHGGFAPLAKQISLKCFSSNPSIKSSLTFLRKTPWARTQVEELFIKLKLYQKS